MRSPRRGRPSTSLTAILLLAFASQAFAESPAATTTVDVTAHQRVTITGDHPSLEALLEDLSWRAGFELRSFGIDDRPISVDLEGVALDDALRRLVGRDHYTAGLAVGPDGTARVTWVEVPGPRERAGGRRGRAPKRAEDEAPFQVPPKLFLAAFASADPAERAQAVATIERRVLDDPAERERFLATDVAKFVEAFAKYPEAPAVLREAGSRQSDAELRAKLEQVVAAIESGAQR